MAAVHVHLGWLADDDQVRTETLALDQGLAGQSVAVLLHIAEVIHREALQQAEFFGQNDAVEHAWGGLFLIPCPAGIQNPFLDLALERVPAPRRAVANVHRIYVRVIQEYSASLAHLAENVAHAIKADLLEAQEPHLLHNAFAHFADLAHDAGDGANLPHKADEGVVLLADASLDPRNDISLQVCFHKSWLVMERKLPYIYSMRAPARTPKPVRSFDPCQPWPRISPKWS